MSAGEQTTVLSENNLEQLYMMGYAFYFTYIFVLGQYLGIVVENKNAVISGRLNYVLLAFAKF